MRSARNLGSRRHYESPSPPLLLRKSDAASTRNATGRELDHRQGDKSNHDRRVCFQTAGTKDEDNPLAGPANGCDGGGGGAGGNNAGSSDHESVIGSWPPLPPKGIRKKAAETLGFSEVAMEMLREQEDRDLHPFGRGGRFEGVLYSRRVKVQVDHAKFLAWIVFASFILLTSGAIIFLAEMERRQKSQQPSTTTALSTPLSTTVSYSNGTA